MNPDQRDEEIRRRVARWRALSLDGRITLPAAVYGELADQAFLVGLVDELRRQLAHYERAPTAPALPVGGATPATSLRALPALRDAGDDAWDQCLTVGAREVDAALVRGMRDGANPYEMRQRAAAALAALRHRQLPAAPLPPAEPPPFTVG